MRSGTRSPILRPSRWPRRGDRTGELPGGAEAGQEFTRQRTTAHAERPMSCDERRERRAAPRRGRAYLMSLTEVEVRLKLGWKGLAGSVPTG